SFIALLPEQNLAVFATNNQMSVAATAVVYEIVDEFLHETQSFPGTDWISILQAAIKDRQSAADAAVAEAWESRDANSKPSLPLEEYAGVYRDVWYGTVRISLEEGRLWFRSERNEPLQGPLEHFQYDTFIARWTDRRLMADAYVTFSLSA